MKLAKNDFEDLAQFLKEQPEQEKQFVAARQIIEAHKTELRRLIRVKNYTYEQVAELLAKKGLQISPNTLKGYLARKRSSKKDIAQSIDDGDKGDREDTHELQHSHHSVREQHPKQHPKKEVNGTVNRTIDSIPVPTSSSREDEHLKPVKDSTSTKIERPSQSKSSVPASLQSSLQADTEPFVQPSVQPDSKPLIQPFVQTDTEPLVKPDSKPQAEPITTAESPEEQQQASTGSSDIYARMRASRS